MNKKYTLEEYYANYLRNIRNSKESTIKHYTGALNTISKMLKNKKKIKNSIYEIDNLSDLDYIKNYLYNDDEFLAKDSRGNRMYKSAIKNYYKFISLEEIEKNINKDKIENIDIPLEINDLMKYDIERRKRLTIVKIQAIKYANYMCEINNSHKTFISKSNLKPYMEAHHIIPLEMQNEFKYSLDVYANIVSICPTCHRFLHYGLESDKKEFLINLYKTRNKRLFKSGIEISQNDFLDLTL